MHLVAPHSRHDGGEEEKQDTPLSILLRTNLLFAYFCPVVDQAARHCVRPHLVRNHSFFSVPYFMYISVWHLSQSMPRAAFVFRRMRCARIRLGRLDMCDSAERLSMFVTEIVKISRKRSFLAHVCHTMFSQIYLISFSLPYCRVHLESCALPFIPHKTQ